MKSRSCRMYNEKVNSDEDTLVEDYPHRSVDGKRGTTCRAFVAG